MNGITKRNSLTKKYNNINFAFLDYIKYLKCILCDMNIKFNHVLLNIGILDLRYTKWLTSATLLNNNKLTSVTLLKQLLLLAKES